MNYRTNEQARQMAIVSSSRSLQSMPYSQRLERWANLLDHYSGNGLEPLRGTEYRPSVQRAILRADNSPLSVAFTDPLLRAHWLAGDTYGDIQDFFGIGDAALHQMVCYCHCGVGNRVSPTGMARILRRAARRARFVEQVARAFGMDGTPAERMLSRAFV
jgi:hypothetical protein